jgi:hypothetical protein
MFSNGRQANHPRIEAITKYGVAVSVFVRMQMSSQNQHDILTLADTNSALHAIDMWDKIYGFYSLATESA